MSAEEAVPEPVLLFRSHGDERDVEAVRAVLERGTWWANGPEIEALEAGLAARCARRHALCFNSGTSALWALLEACEVAGGEVIVPAFTFAATANAVVAAGATPVFADIEPETFGLDAERVAERITPRTRALLPVHFAGDVSRDVERLVGLARETGVPLLEDNAHSLGALREGRPAGSFGRGAMLSHCFNKVLSTGEGGTVVTDDPELRDRMRRLRSHGFSPTGAPDDTGFGLNLRMSSMTAALGLAQLEKLDRLIEERRRLAAVYHEALSEIEGLGLPAARPGHRPVYQLYNVLFADEAARERARKELERARVATRVTYAPLHRSRFYRERCGTEALELPVTEAVSRRILTLPLYPGLREEEQERVIAALRRAG